MSKRNWRKVVACTLAGAMTIVHLFGGGVTCSAAKKAAVQLNQTSLSLKTGQKKTLKVVKKSAKKVKAVTWSVKSKKIATVNGKGVVKGVKQGKTTVTCKLQYQKKGEKKFKKATLTCAVTVKAADGEDADQDNELPTIQPAASAVASVQPSASVAPSESSNPSESVAPVESGKPSESTEPVESGKPSESAEPVESGKPSESAEPVESGKPSESAEPVESGKPSESTEPVESGKPSESTEPVESGKPSESTEPVESVAPSESTEPVESATPSESTEPVESAAPTDTPKATPTDTPKVTPTDTPKATPTDTPKVTPTDTPKATPTDTPKATPTDTPKATPTDTPKVTPTETPTESATPAVPSEVILKISTVWKSDNLPQEAVNKTEFAKYEKEDLVGKEIKLLFALSEGEETTNLEVHAGAAGIAGAGVEIRAKAEASVLEFTFPITDEVAEALISGGLYVGLDAAALTEIKLVNKEGGEVTESPTPEKTPEATPEETPADTPETVPTDTPEVTDTPEPIDTLEPTDTTEPTPEVTETETPEDTPEPTPEVTETETPEETAEPTPEDAVASWSGVYGKWSASSTETSKNIAIEQGSDWHNELVVSGLESGESYVVKFTMYFSADDVNATDYGASYTVNNEENAVSVYQPDKDQDIEQTITVTADENGEIKIAGEAYGMTEKYAALNSVVVKGLPKQEKNVYSLEISEPDQWGNMSISKDKIKEAVSPSDSIAGYALTIEGKYISEGANQYNTGVNVLTGDWSLAISTGTTGWDNGTATSDRFTGSPLSYELSSEQSKALLEKGLVVNINTANMEVTAIYFAKVVTIFEASTGQNGDFSIEKADIQQAVGENTTSLEGYTAKISMLPATDIEGDGFQIVLKSKTSGTKIVGIDDTWGQVWINKGTTSFSASINAEQSKAILEEGLSAWCTDTDGVGITKIQLIAGKP